MSSGLKEWMSREEALHVVARGEALIVNWRQTKDKSWSDVVSELRCYLLGTAIVKAKQL